MKAPDGYTLESQPTAEEGKLLYSATRPDGMAIAWMVTESQAIATCWRDVYKDKILPPGYYLVREEIYPGQNKPFAKIIPMREESDDFDTPIMGNGYYMEGDLDEAVGMCWGDHYQRFTDALNENVAQTYSDIIWGYMVYKDETTRDREFRHAECCRKEYPTKQMKAVMVRNYDSSFINWICPHCGQLAVEYEEAEELFYDSDQLSLDLDDDMADKIEKYALEPHSLEQIAGYRAGLAGYAKAREMTPTRYAFFLEIDDAEGFAQGYQDALSEEEAEAKTDDNDK